MFEAREGLDTQLGERGFAISGGEAQRVALARMLLADFQVLIFDEPTANVDPETGDALIEDLLALASVELGKSCIFISHDERFESLVDQVVRL
jgi:ATP-binding cassette subfamily C protein CydC